ncbi:MAG: hypothetical protein AAF790_01250 [Planctomycetota bacterium]
MATATLPWRLAACLLALGVCTAGAAPPLLEPAVWPRPRPLDAAALARFGIRLVEGTHLTLATDVPPSAEVDELPAVIDAAVPLLAAYFAGDGKTAAAKKAGAEELNGWRVHACLIGDREKFTAAGLMPPPPHAEFPHALSMGYEVWLNRQPSAYYNRALLIHEVTHSFMSTRLGGCGPGWYMEAVAELMAGHRWSAERPGGLALRRLPATRDAAPYWGRVPLVRAAPGTLSVDAVMKLDNNRAMPVESYAAAWSLAKFLDAHPRYRDRWRKLPRIVLRRDFDARFRRAFARDRRGLDAEYQLFARTLEYGHDIEREAIPFRRGKPLEGKPVRVVVSGGRGWQPAGVQVEQGRVYRYRADGRYVVGAEPDGTPWPCEAGGITLAYHGGRPLGQLLAAVVQWDAPALGGGLLRPLPLGPAGEFTAPATGTLYVRVNDSPAKLAANRGGPTLTVWPPADEGVTRATAKAD